MARSVSRAAVRSIVIVMLAMLGACTLCVGVADLWSQQAPEQALAWRRDQHEALLLAAAARRQSGDATNAAALARRALVANPLDGRGYRELALIAGEAGDASRASSLMRLAARRAPRDMDVRGWLLRAAFAEGRMDDAMRQIDVMLRVDPETGKELYPALALAADDPKSIGALADILAASPPWRAAFWGQFCASRASTDAIATVVDLLEHGPTPLAANERAAWIERLIRAQRWGRAYPLWVETLPSNQVAGLTNVRDGSFELPPENGGFGWRFGYVAGAQIERSGAVGASYLHLEFADRRVAFDHVHQLLSLSPGRYRLRGRVQAQGLRSPRGLQWIVTCAEAAMQPIGQSERFNSATPWREFAAEVVVPDTGCGAQWLRLQVAARIAAEQQIDGGIDFTALRIDRAGDLD